MFAPPQLVDYTLCLPPHLRAYVKRVRAQGSFIPPKPAVPADFATSPANADKPLGDDARYSVDALVGMVIDTVGIGRMVLNGPRRQAATVKARHIAIWLAYRHTGLSYAEIGRRFGKRDHTTVINAVRRVDRVVIHCEVRLDEDPRVMARRLWHLAWPKRVEAA